MPKLRINRDGSLSYRRKTGWVVQLCKYANDKICGDSCPFFEEPLYDINSHDQRVLILKICDKTFSLEPTTEFTDHRINQD